MDMESRNREELAIQGAVGMDGNHGSAAELHNESDLTEGMEEMLQEVEEQTDYSQYSKDELLEVVKELVRENDQKKIDHFLREVKSVFDELKDRERITALNRFILDGGSADDFDYRADEKTLQIESFIKQIRDRKTQLLRGQEDQKNENHRKKLELLEKLRLLVDSPDTSNQFNAFKDLQREWKSTGSVPGTHARTVWANYHALVDRFYDNQSIYHELKELDRKKNLEAKIELCQRAEKLSQVDKIKDAIKELNELHHEFKHVGPVPSEEKEAVWQRFKAASDVVYARKDEFIKGLQQELNTNLDQKNVLCDQVNEFANFQSDRIKEWNQKTKEVLDLQKKWEAIGGLPRTKSKEVNKKFWTAFKTFFSNKSAFFKRLDEERGANLKKKNDLILRAIELKDSHEWDKAANELKKLQQEWKAIGPVPEKVRDKVFKEFKEACDFFFEQKRTVQGKQENEQLDNLKAKEEICNLLEKHITENTATPELLRELEEKFNHVGFVPKKDIVGIRNRYHAAIEKFTNAIQGISDDEKSQLMLESQLNDLKNDPMAGQKIYQKEQSIRKRIQKVENDIALWRNNLEFFGRSKNADKYKEEFHAKINEATDALKQLKQQLKLLRAVTL
jgi:hypothetical protein